MKDFSKYSAIIIGAFHATGALILRNLQNMGIKYAQQEGQEALIKLINWQRRLIAQVVGLKALVLMLEMKMQ